MESGPSHRRRTRTRRGRSVEQGTVASAPETVEATVPTETVEATEPVDVAEPTETVDVAAAVTEPATIDGLAVRDEPPVRDDRGAERGLRGLIGAGPSVVGVTGAMRARDAARPSEQDLADAERTVVVVRRNWRPPSA